MNVCVACNQACIDRSLVDAEVSCMVNPRAGREQRHPARSGTATPHRIAVVGGGPAGLAAPGGRRWPGTGSTLFEAADALGGQFRLACRVPGKADYAATVDYYAAELDRLGVEVRLGRPLGPDDADLLRGYAGVIVASGVRPRPLDLPGAGPAARAGLPGRRSPPARCTAGWRSSVAVGWRPTWHTWPAGAPAHSPSPTGSGASTGWSAGPVPVGDRAEVTVLHRGSRLASRTGRSTRWAVLAELARQGTGVLTGVRCTAITADGVRIVDAEGVERLVPADVVVAAVGQLADRTVPELARRAGVWHRVVGGARDAAGLDAVRAFAEGFAAAAAIDHQPDGIAGARPLAGQLGGQIGKGQADG